MKIILDKLIWNFIHIFHLLFDKVVIVVITAGVWKQFGTDVTVISAPSSPSNLSSVTLIGSTESGSGSGSGSDPSPQDGGTYSRRVSEIETPVTTEKDTKGNLWFTFIYILLN